MELLVNELQQLNIQFAIKSEVKTKLADILPLLTKDKLNLLAANYEIKGRSKLKKQELVDAIQAAVTDERELSMALLMTTPEEWALVQRLLSVPYLQDDAMLPGHIFFLIDAGLLYSFYDRDKLYYVLPEDVKEMYSKVVSPAFLKERTRCQQVGTYIRAAMNLYGVCPFDHFIALYNAHHDDQLDEAGLARICDLLTRREQSWHAENGLLIADYYDNDNKEELDELLERVAGKPYYTPDKQEFLRYAEYGYYEETPQLKGLEQYIFQYLCKDEGLVEDLISEIQFYCSLGSPLERIMRGFEDRGIEIPAREQLEMVIHLVINVYNNTRMWPNAGFKPSELGEDKAGSGIDPLRHVVSAKQTPVVSVKIGRNEPCPCGSGKKYKKCCGA